MGDGRARPGRDVPGRDVRAREVPAAASTVLAAVLSGPPRPGRVLAAFPTAVYLHLAPRPGSPQPGAPPDRDAAPAVLAVLTRDAVRLPVGLVLAAPAAAGVLAGVAVGQRAVVGGRRVDLPGLRVVAGRWWDPSVRRVLPSGTGPVGGAAARAAALLSPLPGPLRAPAARLEDALAALPRSGPTSRPISRPASGPESGRLDAAVAALVGLGPGLTPAGDDLLAGAVAALAALGGPAQPLARAVQGHAGRTTPLSAALLHAAADGAAIPQLSGFLRALGGDGDLPTALAALTRVGHTTGAALAAGALLAVDHRAAA